MKTYIKIDGKEKEIAIKELEKLAIGLPHVCIWNNTIETYMPSGESDLDFDPGIIGEYFARLPVTVSYQRCSTIISKTGKELGEYDFYFEWIEEPEKKMLEDLGNQINEVLQPLEVEYEIVEK